MGKIIMSILERQETKSVKTSTCTDRHVQRVTKWGINQLKTKQAPSDTDIPMETAQSGGSQKSREGKRSLFTD